MTSSLFPCREESRSNDRVVVKANDTQDEQLKLSDDEMIAQVRTLMLAGHETVAKTVSPTKHSILLQFIQRTLVL